MTKLIKKSKCKFEAGQIVKKNELIGIPKVVWLQLNKLEVMAQQYQWLKSQPQYQAAPSLDDFERRSCLHDDLPYVDKPNTPVTDKRVEDAMKFMDEVDKVNTVNEVNGKIDEFRQLIEWCAKDKFVEGDCYLPIDTPEIGNPLCLEPSDIAWILKVIAENPIVIEV